MPSTKKRSEGAIDIKMTGVDPETVAPAVLKQLVQAAKKRPLNIELANKPGQPFTVISKPGGGVRWGVGGCGIGG